MRYAFTSLKYDALLMEARDSPIHPKSGALFFLEPMSKDVSGSSSDVISQFAKIVIQNLSKHSYYFNTMNIRMLRSASWIGLRELSAPRKVAVLLVYTKE